MNTTNYPTAQLAEIVNRIVRVAQPEKIILFGSAARGKVERDSDYDLLVIKTCPNRRKLTDLIYRSLIGVGHAVDIVVATPEDVKKYGDNPVLILEPALREGIILYAA